MCSRFLEDMNAEKEVSKFLDEYLYKNRYSFQRCYDKDNQRRGIDVKINNGDILLVDEKAATYYINQDWLQTFVLEISFLGQDGKERDGWFVKDGLDTTHYLLVWITAGLRMKILKLRI